ncbi:MAG: hypothetical protein IKI84_03010 [Clostridia bacterium]|nr:hypothetical protein [Clostridia bacterium]
MIKNCPVCGTPAFPSFSGSFRRCKKCNWMDDDYQEDYPDEGECANHMSLNQARQAWKEGKPIR